MKPTTDEKNKVIGGMLYLVATPIGNLADLSPRAQKVLDGVDFIAAEDTRNSLRLLTHFGISRPLSSYHEHTKRERGETIVARLLAGESCALISDAGTPAISDPGEDLVALCADRGVPVTSIPGCCASITALTLSGLSTARFVFEGFLPMDKKERRARLLALAEETRTVMLHEAPHKLRNTLSELSTALGESRRFCVACDGNRPVWTEHGCALGVRCIELAGIDAAGHFAGSIAAGPVVLIGENAAFVNFQRTRRSLSLNILLVIRQQFAVKYEHLTAFQSTEAREKSEVCLIFLSHVRVYLILTAVILEGESMVSGDLVSELQEANALPAFRLLCGSTLRH